MTEEEQEALSILYVDAARVVKLSSGRFAVFTMARGKIHAIVPEEGLAAAAKEACELSRKAWEESRAAVAAAQERSSAPKSKGTLIVDLADLGL